MADSMVRARAGDAWERERLTPCLDCPHRNLSHNSEEHPTAPLACRVCPCQRFLARTKKQRRETA